MVIYIGLRFILSYSKWNIYIIDYDLVIHALNRSFLLWGAPILFSFYQIQILIYGVRSFVQFRSSDAVLTCFIIF